jgi:hypothetical protein
MNLRIQKLEIGTLKQFMLVSFYNTTSTLDI